MKRTLTALLFVSITAAIGMAQKRVDTQEWKDGKIVTNNIKRGIDEYNGPDASNPGLSSMTYARNDTETLIIETTDSTYTIQRRLGTFWAKRIKLTDPNNVKFRTADNKIYLLNDKGDKVRFDIIELTASLPIRPTQKESNAYRSQIISFIREHWKTKTPGKLTFSSLSKEGLRSEHILSFSADKDGFRIFLTVNQETLSRDEQNKIERSAVRRSAVITSVEDTAPAKKPGYAFQFLDKDGKVVLKF